MTEVRQQDIETEEISDEEAILKIAQAMKDNAPSQDEKHNVHSFLVNVIQTDDIERISKLGNLRDDKDLNEIGIPKWNVRGGLEMATISNNIMDNEFFRDFFVDLTKQTLNTSLSRDGFLIRQASTQTKQVADVTRRRKTKEGMFKSKNIEEQGGDPFKSG